MTKTARGLILSVDARRKLYGSADPALTYTHGALFNGDTDSVFTGALARVAGETSSGERRVGKEGTSSGGPYHCKNKFWGLPERARPGATSTTGRTHPVLSGRAA